MKTAINFRPLFFCFVAYLTAILFAPKFVSNSVWHAVFFCLILLFVCMWAIFNKKFVQASAILLCFVFGFCSFYVEFKQFENVPLFTDQQNVVGRVASVTIKNNVQRVLLEQVEISNQKGKNILLTLYQGGVEVGQKITFSTTLENAKLFELGKFNSTAYQNKVFYYAVANGQDITLIEKTPLTPQENIRSFVFNLFSNHMSDSAATLAYSSIFGDRTLLQSEISQAFNQSGIAHILSVSGMHVAFFVLLVDLILKKLNRSPKFRLVLFAILLLFYAYLCDFNVTVIRAAIMALVFMTSGVLGKQYDGLNSIALAGFLILLINPLSAFGIGFQLSFLCVFIITLFAKPFTKLLCSWRIPKKLAAPLALTVCVQAGILPMIAKYFGSFSLLSVVANLLAVPLFEVGYILAFLFLPLVAIMPFFGFLLTFTSLIFEAVIYIAFLISNAQWAIVQLIELSDYTLCLFYVSIFVLSGFVMISLKHKTIVVCVLLALSFVLAFFESLPITYQNLTIMQPNQTQQTLFITPQGTTLLVGQFDDAAQTTLFLKRAKISKIDFVMSLSKQPDSSFCAQFKVGRVLEPFEPFWTKDFSIDVLQIDTKRVLIISADGHNFIFLHQQLSYWEKDALSLQLQSRRINGIINGKKASFYGQADFLIDTHTLTTNTQTHNNLNNWYLQIKHGIIRQIRSLD